MTGQFFDHDDQPVTKHLNVSAGWYEGADWYVIPTISIGFNGYYNEARLSWLKFEATITYWK